MEMISKAIVDGSQQALLEKLEKEERQAEVKKTHGKTAQVVEPYAANRKQKRAQAKAQRRAK